MVTILASKIARHNDINCLFWVVLFQEAIMRWDLCFPKLYKIGGSSHFEPFKCGKFGGKAESNPGDLNKFPVKSLSKFGPHFGGCYLDRIFDSRKDWLC